MKIARVALIVLGAGVVAAAAATAVAFIPAVQRWALLRMAARSPGTSLTVERFAIRPGMCAVRELRLTRPGLRLEAAAITADLSLWEAVVHRRLVMRNLTVTGLRVDVTPPPDAAASPAGAAPAFGGILRHWRPPWEIAVGSCRIDAEIGLAGTRTRPGRRVRIGLTGGNLAPGRQARFDFEAAVQERGPGRPVEAIEGRGILTAALDRQSRLEQVGVRMAATASGPLLRAPARLEVDLTLARTAGGESYVLALRSPETGTEGRLLDVAAAWEPGSAGPSGSWQLRVGRQQIAPFVPWAALPGFTAAGEGQFAWPAAAGGAHLSGRLAGDCNQLEILDPRLRALGRLGVTAAFDLECDRDAVRVSRLLLNLGGARPVASLEAVQPFSWDLRSPALTAADRSRDVLRLSLEGLPAAWAQPFVSGVAIAGGELEGTLAASLHEGRLWMHTAAPLAVKGLALAAAGRAVLPASDVRIEGGLERAPAATRIRVDALTLKTAAGDRIDARGEWNFGTGNPAAGSLRADCDFVLPARLADWMPLGPVQGRAAIAATVAGGAAQVDHLEAHLATSDGRPLADLTSETPFRFDRARGLVAMAAGEAGEVLRLEFGRLPLTLFQPWCGRWRLRGEILPGGLRARADQAGLRVAAPAPLRVAQFALGGPGGTWVQDLAVEFEPAVSFAAGGVTASVAAARVTNAGGAPLLSAHAEVTLGTAPGGAGARGAAGFDMLIPALAGQPVLGGTVPPPQGHASGEVTFTFNHDLLGEGRFTLNGLVSPANGEPLPVANLSFRAGWSEQGTIAVQAPLLIDRAGERSDLTVSATVHAQGPNRRLEAKIAGQHFVVDDARALVRAFRQPPAASGESPAAGGPAAAPPWAPLTGQVTLAVDSLVCDRNIEVTGLAGTIALEPGRIAVEKITGRLGPEGVLQVGGELRFAAGAPEPFTARYDFQLRDCEIGPLFSDAAPNEPPALEGRFNVRSQAAGAGRTLAEVVERTRGDYVLQSRKGTFRALQLSPPAPRASGIVGGAARLIDNLGEKVGSLVSYDAPTQELAGLLTSFPYDQLNARLSRDAGRNLVIADFTLVSPLVRLQGSGTVAYEAGKGMFERPLQLQLTVGVMGKAEAMVTRFKSPALAGGRDELGFLKLKEPFAVVGTLGRPDAGQLYAMLKPSLRERILP